MRDPTYEKGPHRLGADLQADVRPAVTYRIPPLTPETRRTLAAVELAIHRILYQAWSPTPAYLLHLADQIAAVAAEVEG